MEVYEFEQYALSLPIEARALLAEKLLESMDASASEKGVLGRWLDLGEKRLKEIRDGRVAVIGKEDVFSSLNTQHL